MKRNWISREEIAEIYDGLAWRERSFERAWDWAETAYQIRKVDELKPLVRDRGGMLVRSESNSW
jgi:hypothetical protein